MKSLITSFFYSIQTQKHDFNITEVTDNGPVMFCMFSTVRKDRILFVTLF